MDLGKGERVPYIDLLNEILELVAEDADRLGCVAEIDHTRAIVERGTSATWQLDAFQLAKTNGADDEQALNAVVDMLIARTTDHPATEC